MITLLLASCLICFPLLLAVRAHFRNLTRADSTAKDELFTREASTLQWASPYTTAAFTRRPWLRFQARGAIGCANTSVWPLSRRAMLTRSAVSTLRLIYTAPLLRLNLSTLGYQRVILRARHTKATQVTLSTSVHRTLIDGRVCTGISRRTRAQNISVSKWCSVENSRNRRRLASITKLQRSYGAPRPTHTTSNTPTGE